MDAYGNRQLSTIAEKQNPEECNFIAQQAESKNITIVTTIYLNLLNRIKKVV